MKELDWKILIVLYEKRSITKTAEALYLTQSAVTKRLQNMENEWGIKVIRRSSQGVAFTEDGTYLAQKARIMLDFLREIREHYAQRNSRKDALAIGIPHSFSRLYFPEVLSAYIQQYDRLDIQLIPNSSEVVLQKLVDGSVDLGFVCGDYPYLGEKTLLMDEPLYLLAPIGTVYEELESKPLIQRKMNPLVEMILEQWWKSQYGTLPGVDDALRPLLPKSGYCGFRGIGGIPFPDGGLEISAALGGIAGGLFCTAHSVLEYPCSLKRECPFDAEICYSEYIGRYFQKQIRRNRYALCLCRMPHHQGTECPGRGAKNL